MAEAVNLHWLSRNANRAYPVDDRATRMADDSHPLPPGILADISVRWPEEYGSFGYVTAVSVTARLVTVMLGASTALDEQGTDIAAVTVAKPVTAGSVIRLTSLVDGVAGWLVLGPASDDFRGMFATPAQSLLCPRAGRSYASPGLTGVRSAESGTWLQGHVQLRAEAPLQLKAESRVIHGRTVRAIVVSLAETTGNAYPVPAAASELVVGDAPSVYAEFSGPCGHRPESRNCLGLPPVETIGGVSPDCDGVLTLSFTGCANVSEINNLCGVVVTCDTDLSSLCPHGTGADGLPSAEGLLPSELVNTPVIAESEFASPDPPTYPDTSELPPANVPYLLCATGDPDYDSLAEVKNGTWGYDDDASPYDPCGTDNDDVGLEFGRVFLSEGAGQRNLLIAAEIGGSVNRLGSMDFKMLTGPSGARHNAHGISLFNDGDRPGTHTYAAVEVSYDLQAIRVLWFDGRRFTELASTSITNLRLDKWYRLSWRVESTADPQLIRLRGGVTSVEDGSVNASVSVDTGGDRLPGTGRMGMGTDRAVTRFMHMALGVI